MRLPGTHDRRRALVAALLASAAAALVLLLAVGPDRDDGETDQRGEADIEPTPADGGELPPGPVPPPSGPAAVTQLGFYPLHPNNGGIEHFDRLERWLGREIEYMVQFGDASSPTAFRRNLRGQFSTENLAGRAEDGFRLVYSVPLAFGPRYSEATASSIEEQWDMLLEDRGGRRRLYEEAAELLVGTGFGDAIIRLGWEFDSLSSPWYAGVDPAKFQEVWRVVHGIFEAASPGFLFDYNFLLPSAGRPLIEQAYPGDRYVDVIGADHYDNYSGEGGVPGGQDFGYEDPELVWERGFLPFLRAHAEFARARGKPVSFPEWALSDGGRSKAGAAGGDNPTYIRRTFEWMNHVGGPGGPGLLYSGYFEEPSSPDGNHAIAAHPESARVFEELFGSP